jgi:hypothetical protein
VSSEKKSVVAKKLIKTLKDGDYQLAKKIIQEAYSN